MSAAVARAIEGEEARPDIVRAGEEDLPVAWIDRDRRLALRARQLGDVDLVACDEARPLPGSGEDEIGRAEQECERQGGDGDKGYEEAAYRARVARGLM